MTAETIGQPSDFALLSALSAELRGDVYDDADNATALQMLEIESGILALREQAKPEPQLFAEDGVTVLCWECESVIPPERLAVMPKACFCLGCQEAIERRANREMS